MSNICIREEEDKHLKNKRKLRRSEEEKEKETDKKRGLRNGGKITRRDIIGNEWIGRRGDNLNK